mgnify:CR=1 FL=1|tara:strand:+ start:117 stop:458 length:342 start_codon:yes stop_codon:yes gene_type:complete
MTSEFFKSELVRGEIQEMMEMQQLLMKYAISFPVLTKEKKDEYLVILERLLEMQEIMYNRMKLSDDEDARAVIENMKQGVILMGVDENLTVPQMFKQLRERIDIMLEETQKEG